jgi:membrane protein DedA with SNARE-associated domain
MSDVQPAVELPSSTGTGKNPPKWLGGVLIAIIIGLYVLGFATNGLATKLVDKHPLGLIALSPRYRYYILGSSRIDAIPYYLVGIGRLIISDPVYFSLGWFFGDRAIAFFEDSLGKQTMDQTRGFFLKASTVMALFFAGPIICVLAGAAGMKAKKFFTLNLIGTTIIVIALRVFAKSLDGPVQSLLRFNKQYSKYILIASIGLSVLYLSRGLRKQVGAAKRFRK